MGAGQSGSYSIWRYLPMPVQWRNDIEEALAEAASDQKPLLLDFSAAPA